MSASPIHQLNTPTSLYIKSPGIKRTITNNLVFFSFKSKLRKIYQAIEYERSREQSNTISTDLESLEIFEIFCNGLSKSKSLQTLDLSSTNLPDLNMIRLSQSLAKNKTLTHLDLSNNNLSSLGFKYLFRMLKENNHLRALNLFNNEIQKETIQDMSSFIIRNKSLIEINLNFCGMDCVSSRTLLEALTSSSHFKKVHLSKNFFDDTTYQAVSFFLSKTFMKLETFDFAYNQLDDKTLKILKRKLMRLPLEHVMPTIHEINLMGNKFMDPNAIKHLRYILERINGIQTLNLSKTFINFKNFLLLAPCFKRVHTTLLLSNNVFRDQLPENLSSLVHLKHLNLSRTNLSGNSIINLSKTIEKEKKLQWISLDLSHNQLFNEDTKVLFQSLKYNKTLTILNLSDNLIDEAVFENYEIYSKEWCLENLDISENPFRSLEFLTNMLMNQENSTLKVLTIDNIALMKKKTLLMADSLKKEYLYNPHFKSKLETLSLKHSMPLGPFLMKNLANFTDLLELNLENACIFNKEYLTDLGGFLGMTNKLANLSLKNLYLGKLVSPEIDIICNALTLNKSLIKLNLSKNKLNKSLGVFLKAISQIKTLKSLDISNNYIDNKHSQVISDFLLDLPNLEEYILSNNLISFVTIDKLCLTIIDNFEKINLKCLKLANISFSLDCLISIGYLLDGYSKLLELDLSNNEIVKINTATLCNKPTNIIKNLVLTNCKYDEYQYKLLIKLLAKNPIKFLDLSGSVFLEADLSQFIKKTAKLQNLTTLDLSYIALKDVEIGDLLNRLKNHQVLQDLKLNFLDLNENSSKSLCQLLKNSKSLKTLDLSDNKLNSIFYSFLKTGLIDNQTLKELKLRKTRMTDESFEILIEAFRTNKSLKLLDLRYNNFSINSLEKFIKAMNENPSKEGLETLLLSENHLENKDISEEFTFVRFSQELKQNLSLSVIDLANTFPIKPSEISSLSESLKIKQNLRKLNLSDNNLGQNEAVFLSKLILSCVSLEYLSVSNNKFGITGIKILLSNLDKNLCLKEINISGTLNTKPITEAEQIRYEQDAADLCQFLHNILIKYDTLEIIDVSDNYISEKGNKIITNTLKSNKKLYYINTQWYKTHNELAHQILNSLERLYNRTQNVEEANEKIKYLNFSNGKLDDDFCIYFAHHLQDYTYLESLNISYNKKITLIGLKFIYVYLKFNAGLKKIYFKEYSHESALNNGISTSLIHWSKYAHYHNRCIIIIQKLTGFIFSKMQIVPNMFQYNESFDKFFEPIKDIYIFWFFLLNFLLQIFLAVFLPIRYAFECGGGQYWVSHILYGIYLGVTLLLEIIFWLVTKKKIQSTVIEKDLKREYLINDLLNLVGGVLLRFDTYTDVCFLTIVHQCNASNNIFIPSLIVILLHLIVKCIENIRTLYKLYKKIQKKQKMDCLNLYAKLCCFQSFIITNDILDRYCPGNAKRIKHILCKRLQHSVYLNIFILDSFLKFALEDCPQTIIQCAYLFDKDKNRAADVSNWIIWFSVIKNILSLFGSFYSTVSIRPSYIEQSDFDESLSVQKLFEGRHDSQFGLTFIKRVPTLETRTRMGFMKFGTGFSSASANKNSQRNMFYSVNKQESSAKDAVEKESDIMLELSEDVSFEKPEKMRYFQSIQTEEKANNEEGIIIHVDKLKEKNVNTDN